MPQSSHERIAELHNLAAHAHADAAVAHGKGDHLTGHELSKLALEHSMNAHRHSEGLESCRDVDQLLTKASYPSGAQKCTDQTPQKLLHKQPGDL